MVQLPIPCGINFPFKILTIDSFDDSNFRGKPELEKATKSINGSVIGVGAV